METKKSHKADLEHSRSIFFEIGLVLALALVLFAFEWSGSTKTGADFGTLDVTDLEEEIIPITREQTNIKPPPPPKPTIPEILNIVEDEIEIEDELLLVDVEADQETKFEINEVFDLELVEEETTEEVFYIVEEMPRFDGKDRAEFRKYISENLKYPEIAIENGISGTVYIQFTVNRYGQVVDVVVVRSVDPSLDHEAIRVIQSSPKWTPGKQRGKAVSVSFTFPIHFILNG